MGRMGGRRAHVQPSTPVWVSRVQAFHKPQIQLLQDLGRSYCPFTNPNEIQLLQSHKPQTQLLLIFKHHSGVIIQQVKALKAEAEAHTLNGDYHSSTKKAHVRNEPLAHTNPACQPEHLHTPPVSHAPSPHPQ